MPAAALALVVAAALLHAVWNVAAKRAGGDHRFAFATAAAVGIVWLPAALWFAPRELPRWGWAEWGVVSFSAAVRVAYFLTLLRGYREADLSVVYTVARGSAPLVTALAAVLLLGERLGAVEYDSLNKSGLRVIDRLHKHGILGPKTITAHGVHFDAREIQLLIETGTWLSHQPRSNMNNGVGVAPIESMMRAGIKVCLGNDGFSNAMWEEWKAAYLLHKVHHRDPRRMGGYDVQQLAIYNNAALTNVFFPFCNHRAIDSRRVCRYYLCRLPSQHPVDRGQPAVAHRLRRATKHGDHNHRGGKSSTRR